jgi:hypothetical protein
MPQGHVMCNKKGLPNNFISLVPWLQVQLFIAIQRKEKTFAEKEVEIQREIASSVPSSFSHILSFFYPFPTLSHSLLSPLKQRIMFDLHIYLSDGTILNVKNIMA